MASATQPSPTPPQTADQLRNTATSQVEQELAGQLGPLQAEQTSLQTKEGASVSAIDRMFSGVQPFVTGAADKVKASYDQAYSAEQGIYQAAGQQLNNLKQSAASEAQTLAQKMGGPVAINEFTQ